MATVTATYIGDLRVDCAHLQSGTHIITDAPTDNGGKGQAFSPTDLVATALGACAATIMAKYAESHGMDIAGTTLSITKVMSSAPPRRIAAIEVIFNMPDKPFTDAQKQAFENAAKACPVHRSLHADMEQRFIFNWHK